MKSSYLKAVLGVLLIAVASVLLYIFRNQTTIPLVYFMGLVMLAIGAGILANFISGKASYDSKPVYATNGFYVAGFIVVTGIGFYMNNRSFNYTIIVRDRDKQNVNLHEAKLQVFTDDIPSEWQIDNFGSVTIKGLSADKKNTWIKVQLLNAPDWVFQNNTKADSVYLDKNSATLIIQPDNERCCLKGQVRFAGNDHPPLSSVIVKARDWNTVCDEFGNYSINVPAKFRLQSSFRIEAFTKNYKGSLDGNTATINDIQLSEK
jgi:hypothetical protein